MFFLFTTLFFSPRFWLKVSFRTPKKTSLFWSPTHRKEKDRSGFSFGQAKIAACAFKRVVEVVSFSYFCYLFKESKSIQRSYFLGLLKFCWGSVCPKCTSRFFFASAFSKGNDKWAITTKKKARLLFCLLFPKETNTTCFSCFTFMLTRKEKVQKDNAFFFCKPKQ